MAAAGQKTTARLLTGKVGFQWADHHKAAKMPQAPQTPERMKKAPHATTTMLAEPGKELLSAAVQGFKVLQDNKEASIRYIKYTSGSKVLTYAVINTLNEHTQKMEDTTEGGLPSTLYLVTPPLSTIACNVVRGVSNKVTQ